MDSIFEVMDWRASRLAITSDCVRTRSRPVLELGLKQLTFFTIQSDCCQLDANQQTYSGTLHHLQQPPRKLWGESYLNAWNRRNWIQKDGELREVDAIEYSIQCKYNRGQIPHMALYKIMQDIHTIVQNHLVRTTWINSSFDSKWHLTNSQLSLWPYIESFLRCYRYIPYTSHIIYNLGSSEWRTYVWGWGKGIISVIYGRWHVPEKEGLGRMPRTIPANEFWRLVKLTLLSSHLKFESKDILSHSKTSECKELVLTEANLRSKLTKGRLTSKMAISCTVSLWMAIWTFKNGKPTPVLTDDGIRLVRMFVKRIRAILETSNLTTTAFRSQTSGHQERFSKTIIAGLPRYVAVHQRDSDIFVQPLTCLYRVETHCATNSTSSTSYHW